MTIAASAEENLNSTGTGTARPDHTRWRETCNPHSGQGETLFPTLDRGEMCVFQLELGAPTHLCPGHKDKPKNEETSLLH